MTGYPHSATAAGKHRGEPRSARRGSPEDVLEDMTRQAMDRV